jgi:hypothetical protein
VRRRGSLISLHNRLTDGRDIVSSTCWPQYSNTILYYIEISLSYTSWVSSVGVCQTIKEYRFDSCDGRRKKENLCFLHKVQTGSATHPASYTRITDIGGCFPLIKR